MSQKTGQRKEGSRKHYKFQTCEWNWIELICWICPAMYTYTICINQMCPFQVPISCIQSHDKSVSQEKFSWFGHGNRSWTMMFDCVKPCHLMKFHNLGLIAWTFELQKHQVAWFLTVRILWFHSVKWSCLENFSVTRDNSKHGCMD